MAARRRLATALTLAALAWPAAALGQSAGVGSLGSGGGGTGLATFEAGSGVQGKIAVSRKYAPVPELNKLKPSKEALDGDIADLLNRSKEGVAAAPSAVSADLIAVLSSPDDYTKAQWTLLSSPAAQILAEAAAKLEASSLPDAVVASDAAWVLRERAPDPGHARLLIAFADTQRADNPGEALWLARRALIADPANAAALELDSELSNNPAGWLGWTVFWTGVGAMVGGVVIAIDGNGVDEEIRSQPHERAELEALLDERDLHNTLSIAGYGGGLALIIGGALILANGARDYKPVSPASLPALSDKGRR